MDQLYGNFGGKNGNVYLDLLAEGTRLCNPIDAHLAYRMKFWLTARAPASVRARFAKRSPDDWARLLKVDVSDLDLGGIHRGRIALASRMASNYGGWEEAIAVRFILLSTVFQSFLRL
jgi:hypothetical protein